MPQFDTFIFSSSLFYFIISFMVVLYGNHARYLPRLSSILKLRNKVSTKVVFSQKKENAFVVKGFSYNTTIKD